MTLHQTAAANAADLPDLAAQFATLRRALQSVDANAGAHQGAIAAVAAAEHAAHEGDRSRVITHLAHAGEWALDVAKGIGVPVAVEVLTHALGLAGAAGH